MLDWAPTPESHLLLKFLDSPEKQRSKCPQGTKVIRNLWKTKGRWDQIIGGSHSSRVFLQEKTYQKWVLLHAAKMGSKRLPWRKLKHYWLKYLSRSQVGHLFCCLQTMGKRSKKQVINPKRWSGSFLVSSNT